MPEGGTSGRIGRTEPVREQQRGTRVRGGVGNQAFVREQITRYILDNGLRAGDPLPSEQTLMAELDVGRHPLREAMKALQALGIVEIRHGYGTYVGTSSFQSLEDGLSFRMSQSMAGDLAEVRNVLQVRQAIEVGLAGDVVAGLSADGLVRLERIVAEMEERAGRGEYFPEQDWAFHEALYQPIGNTLVTDLLAVFWRTFSRVDTELNGPHYSPTDAAGWHRDLLERLREGDAAEFAASMRRHFHGINSRF